MLKPSFSLIIWSCLFASSLSAQIIFDNGVGGAAGVSDGYSSDFDSPSIAADDFLLGTDAVVNGIEWTGIYAFFDSPPAEDVFTINIHDDNGGEPGAIISSTFAANLVNRTDSGFDEPTFGFDIYNFTATLTPFHADAGSTYWVSVINDTTGAADTFLWGIINGTGNSAGSTDSGASWLAEGHQADFRLLGFAIPEPTSAVFGLGVIALLVTRRKR